MDTRTVLLITTDKTGTFMAQIQSGQTPMPRIVIVGSRQALKDAVDEQKNGTDFYDSIFSVGLNQELREAKKEFEVEDGSYKKVSGKIEKC
jgi:hypothetical protein